MVGSEFNDTIIGDNKNNKFIPHRGNDSIDGNVGNKDWVLYNESKYRIIAYFNETYISIPEYYENDKKRNKKLS